MDDVMMLETAEALFDIGGWRWQDDEIVWEDTDAENNTDKDVSND